jgi:hypothetical protein
LIPFFEKKLVRIMLSPVSAFLVGGSVTSGAGTVHRTCPSAKPPIQIAKTGSTANLFT